MTQLLGVVPNRVRDCLMLQLGTIAARNSCRNGWSQRFNMRASIKPDLGARLHRRLQFGVDMFNVSGGLDKLLHRPADLRGWGQPNIADPTLLYPRGFDPATLQYRYEVNQLFGQNRTQRMAGAPFQIQITGSLALGAQSASVLSLAAISFGGMGGAAGGRGGRGGAGGRFGAGGAGGAGGFDISSIAPRFLPNPVQNIIGMKDTLHLTFDQVTRLQRIADSLKVENFPLVNQIVDKLRAAGANPDFGQIIGVLQPVVEQGRHNIASALAEAQKILTPEQWQNVPENVRSPTGGFRIPGGT
jgi:hypothetical protein